MSKRSLSGNPGREQVLITLGLWVGKMRHRGSEETAVLGKKTVNLDSPSPLPQVSYRSFKAPLQHHALRTLPGSAVVGAGKGRKRGWKETLRCGEGDGGEKGEPDGGGLAEKVGARESEGGGRGLRESPWLAVGKV